MHVQWNEPLEVYDCPVCQQHCALVEQGGHWFIACAFCKESMEFTILVTIEGAEREETRS